MKKVFFTTILLLTFCGSVFAQGETLNANKPSWFSVKNITYGGILGASFTTNTSAITIAPQVGYNFTDWLNAGVGIRYSYLNFNNGVSTEKNNYAGFDIYGRTKIFQFLLLQIQPEIDHVWWTSNENFSGDKTSGSGFVPSFIVGAGFWYQHIYAMLFYDVIQNQRSPYGNTIGYSVGFSF